MIWLNSLKYISFLCLFQIWPVSWAHWSTHRPAQNLLINMELEKLSNGTYNHDAAAAVEKGFVLALMSCGCIHSHCPHAAQSLLFTATRGRLILASSKDQYLSFFISWAVWLLHVESCCWFDVEKITFTPSSFSSFHFYFTSWTWIFWFWTPAGPAWPQHPSFCLHWK